MAHEINVPRLGWSMEEGTFVEWLKQEGEQVEAGELLFSVESDKAVVEIDSIDSGILCIRPDAPKAGELVSVGDVLGYLVEPGESAPVGEGGGTVVPADLESQPSTVVSAPAAGAPGEPSAEAPRRAARPSVSPRAARLAAELGVDLSRVAGSGRGGRVRERDVRAAAQVRGASRESPTPTPGARSRALPLTRWRRAIAENMSASARSSAAVTLTTRVDATELVDLRAKLAAPAAGGDVAPTYTDLIVVSVAAALAEHPLLNASWSDEQIVLHEDIHIGIAVETEAGLLVPVLRNVTATSLGELAARSREMIERVRSGRPRSADLQPGTFTITNLGPHGIDAFTPIIHRPQCAILGVGRIHREPVVRGDAIVPRDVMTLSLTFDHRVVDGAPAARFLDTVREYVEQPGPRLSAGA